MKVHTERLTATAELTCYVADRSPEMAGAAIRPAVLVLPGGGYLICSDREAEPVALAYLAHGFDAFVLQYAVGADVPWSASFADAVAALAWIRAHATDLGTDPTRVAAVGFSAGGHLAASLGVSEGHRPDALILGYPAILADAGTALDKELPDITAAVSPNTPPTFVFATSGDSVVPVRHTIALCAALAEHEVPFESHVYLLGPHGLSLATALTAAGNAANVDDAVASWLTGSVRFLHRVFGTFPTSGEPNTFSQLAAQRRFGLEMPVGRLLADPRAVQVLAQFLGEHARGLAHPLVSGLSLRELAALAPALRDQQPVAGEMSLGWASALADPGVVAALGEALQALEDGASQRG